MLQDRQRWHGHILYRGKDGSTGEERFDLCEHGDGSQTLRALCRMDDVGLVRDAILAVGADGHPTEAFIRIVERGSHSGSAFYRIDGGAIEAVLGSSGETRQLRLKTPCRFFGTHSLINDGWLARLGTGLEEGETRVIEPLVTCSHQADGGGAPDLLTASARLTALGEVRRKTAAGSFSCRGYAVQYGDFPPLRMWVTGPLALLVWMEWSHLDATYELVELTSA